MPIYKFQDTVGPMVQTVRDAALILQIMAGKLKRELTPLAELETESCDSGKDPLDKATDDIPFSSIPDYVAACRSDAFRGARIAVRYGHHD